MDDYKQQVIKLFNSRTAYDSEEGTHHPQEANRLLEFVPLHKGQRILDVATGTGLVSIPAAQKVGLEGHVIGIDISPGMLHQARQKIEAAKLHNIELIEADAELITFSDQSFDIIFCCSAIVFLTDISSSLHKWYHFLKIGGWVAFTCPPETAYMASVYRNLCARFGLSLPHLLEPMGTPEKCHNLLQQAGFKNIEIEIEPRGRYRSLNDERLFLWMKNGFYPQGNPLSKLDPEQLSRLQVEYRVELQKLATDKGVWEDTTTFFVRGKK